MSDKLIQELKKFEGLKLKAYRCPQGKLTIGYGHNLDDNGIPQEIADRLLEIDIMSAITDAMRFVKNFKELNQIRQEVIIQMAFQLGYTTLNYFTKTRTAIETELFELASREMLDSLWARQTPSRAILLANRMKTGEYE